VTSKASQKLHRWQKRGRVDADDEAFEKISSCDVVISIRNNTQDDWDLKIVS
jgi:hypothetical protein